RLTSREPTAVAGTEIVVNGGKIDIVRDGGEAPGTQVEVRSIFYNVPARRKFLRAENTESRNIEHQLHLQAIGHPQVAFTFARDERTVFQLPATTTLADRIRDLHGKDLLDQLLAIDDWASGQVRISGLIGRAGLSRQTRSQLLVFANGRAIESPVITSAIREGYHTALMKGQYPVTFLFLEVDPGAVDVNVHPAKREVRFRDPNGIREAVVQAIQQTLAGGRAEWQEKFRGPVPATGGTTGVHPELVERASSQFEQGGSPPCELPQFEKEFGLRGERGVEFTPAAIAPNVSGSGGSPNRQAIEINRPYQQFQIIGVLNKLYVLMENADGLVLVDQHAAHERILFEELRRRMEEQGVPSQKLLISQTFELPPRDADWIEQNVGVLQKMGIGIESFGPNTFRIDSLPGFLNVTDGAQFMRKVIDDLKSASDRTSPLRLGEEIIAKTVCRHAVKANDPLRYLEVEKLIQDLLDCELPYCCPHGRPTMIQISNAELEKKFGRKV
ncbi:MAG TPA: DNA mismatch repair endonuclease MutL, partial [Chthoniobacterales bacterium]|nr:DNA mismatch repair endonuclease MutL [Chthoniobacterales bacterium]